MTVVPLLSLVTIMAPLLVGIAVGYFALRGVIGALETAFTRAQAQSVYVAADHIVPVSAARTQRAGDRFKVAA